MTAFKAPSISDADAFHASVLKVDASSPHTSIVAPTIDTVVPGTVAVVTATLSPSRLRSLAELLGAVAAETPAGMHAASLEVRAGSLG
jgi:hypothetical protein